MLMNNLITRHCSISYSIQAHLFEGNERLLNTMFEVEGRTGTYSECGRTEGTLLPNNSIIIIPCSTPLITARLRLRRYGGPHQQTIHLCEVLAIGYIYQGMLP